MSVGLFVCKNVGRPDWSGLNFCCNPHDPRLFYLRTNLFVINGLYERFRGPETNKKLKRKFYKTFFLYIFQYPCSARSNLLVKEDSKISSTKSNLNLNKPYMLIWLNKNLISPLPTVVGVFINTMKTTFGFKFWFLKSFFQITSLQRGAVN